MKKVSILCSVIVISLILIGSPVLQSVLANPGTGILYGTDANGSNLLTVNTATGMAAIAGNMGIGASPSLSVDPTTGIIYVGTGGGAPNLYTVTPVGVATLVAPAGPNGNTGLGVAAVGGMDFDSSGTLYAAVNIAGDGGTGSDHLATLNKVTGVATIIGPFGACVGVVVPSAGGGSCTIEGIEGIAFDAAGNMLGVKTQRGAAGAPGLYSININTGAANFLVPLLNAAGAPASGGFASIQFACNGTLFGGTARAIQVNDGGFLATINPVTGQFTLKPNAATGGSSLGALGFGSACQAVGGELLPLDTTMVLVAGTQTAAAWMIPVIVSAIGIGIVIARKF